MFKEMDCPCPCEGCGEWFELHDGPVCENCGEVFCPDCVSRETNLCRDCEYIKEQED